MAQIVLPTLYPLQQEIKDDPAQFKVLAIGRQAGKTFFARNEVLDRVLNLNQNVWWIAPVNQTAKPNWRKLKNMLENAPFLKYKNESDLYMEFEGGGALAIKSADRPDNLRGESLDYVVFDEAAFIQPYVWYEVVMPMLGATDGGALFLSTPNGRNWFYDLWQLGQKDNPKYDPLWASWQFPSTASPYFSKKMFEMARKMNTRDKFEKEYLAYFGTAEGGVFHNLDDACVLTPTDEPDDEMMVVIGVDIARKKDYTVFSIFDKNTGNQLAIERFSDTDFTAQSLKLTEVMRKWNPVRIYIETNSFGEAVYENFKKLVKGEESRITPVYMTNAKKIDIIDRFIVNLEQGRTKLLNRETPNGHQQYSEMSNFMVQHTMSGMNVTYRALPGEHDDCVMAAALANIGIRRKSRPDFEISDNPFYR